MLVNGFNAVMTLYPSLCVEYNSFDLHRYANLIVGILREWLSHFPHHHFIQNMFDYQTLPKHHLKSQGTHGSTPILLMCSVLSMEATLFALQPLLSIQTPAIAKASSHKCLIACGFDLRALYVLSRWEGSAADAILYHDVHCSDLRIPPCKFYLADAGFGACDKLLIPY
jgi:hypothetical protein